MPANLDIAGVTHVGGREENQDRFAVIGGGVVVVADGMGGHAGGALAAELTVDAATRRLEADGPIGEDAIAAAFTEANDLVRSERIKRVEEQRMGATLTVAGLADPSSNEWILAHVGDSPAYLVSSTAILRLTDDHTVAGELVRQGAISEAAAEEHPQRNVLLKAVGAEESIEPDMQRIVVGPGDALVLVSDGISGFVALPDIRDMVRTAETSSEAADLLVNAALELESTDNCTAVVVRLLSQEEEP